MSIPPIKKRFNLALLEMPDVMKDKANTFTKSKYATLHSVLSAVKPVLAGHHLAIRQETKIVPETHMMMIETYVVSTDVEDTSDDLLINTMILPEKVDDKNPAHSLGKSLTYCRRYSLLVALAIVADEDDDGNSMQRKKVDVPKKDNRSLDQVKKDCIEALRENKVTVTPQLEEIINAAEDKLTVKEIYGSQMS